MAHSNSSAPNMDFFTDKDTYGISTSSERDRLPKIRPDAKGTFDKICIGRYTTATRLAVAGLAHAEEAEDIARLVIGAVVDASGIDYISARLHDDVHNPKGWDLAVLRWAKEIRKQETHKEDSVVTEPLPAAHLPAWFLDLEVPSDDLYRALSYKPMELASYAGILAYAVAKQPNSENLKAFNENRRKAVREFMPSGEMEIFKDSSEYLTLEILRKVHRTFNTLIVDRALCFGAIVDAFEDTVSMERRGFYTMFNLSRGAALNPLLIIIKFLRKYPGIVGLFPDLSTEIRAARHAAFRFRDTNEKRRLFLKLIFGSAYVPVDRQDINGLLGVATFGLAQTDKTLENYKGGSEISVKHRDTLMEYLEIPVTKEEAVPETE